MCGKWYSVAWLYVLVCNNIKIQIIRKTEAFPSRSDIILAGHLSHYLTPWCRSGAVRERAGKGQNQKKKRHRRSSSSSWSPRPRRKRLQKVGGHVTWVAVKPFCFGQRSSAEKLNLGITHTDTRAQAVNNHKSILPHSFFYRTLWCSRKSRAAVRLS